MRDVDHARIHRAWQAVRGKTGRLATFTDTVLAHGAAACAHPSGRARPAARVPLGTTCSPAQVRIGTAADDARNPYAYRGRRASPSSPTLLGTSLLAVGPPGSGKTTRLVRPVAESLCLQALAGQAAVVAVGAGGGGLGPDDAFDVVVRIGHPDSVHDLDLYGGTTDPDEAAAMLAEALVGDLADPLPGGDSRRAATALAQLLGPFRAAHGRFPSVPELRELLDGAPGALGRAAHRAGGRRARVAAARTRRPRTAVGPPRRSSARCSPTGSRCSTGPPSPTSSTRRDSGDPSGRPSFSLRALDHPLRVRIDLPERGHAEASRILARLVLAQFTECAVARDDRSLFACLVLDDAAQTITPEALRGLQRLRSAQRGRAC